MKYLLDTNALIYLQGGKLAEGLPVGTYAYSVISEIELLSWPEMQPEQELVWRGLLATLHRVEVGASVRETAIRLRRERRLKLPDAVVVASALVLDAVLLTNDQQLLTLPGLRSQPLELKHD
ncbi:MAG: PIN domain-containing protein [Gallionella sp.]|nr:PIN domain-containing protein [Gallionella sp.]